VRVCLFCCCFLYVLDLVCVLTRFPPRRLGGPWAPGPFPIFTSMGTEYLQKRFPICLNRVRGKNDSAGPATLPITNQDLNTTHQLTHTHTHTFQSTFLSSTSVKTAAVGPEEKPHRKKLLWGSIRQFSVGSAADTRVIYTAARIDGGVVRMPVDVWLCLPNLYLNTLIVTNSLCRRCTSAMRLPPTAKIHQHCLMHIWLYLSMKHTLLLLFGLYINSRFFDCRTQKCIELIKSTFLQAGLSRFADPDFEMRFYNCIWMYIYITRVDTCNSAVVWAGIKSQVRVALLQREASRRSSCPRINKPIKFTYSFLGSSNMTLLTRLCGLCQCYCAFYYKDI